MKIVIAGVGAVGGYFGGLLAKHYEQNKAAGIYFLARGEHLKEIQTSGVKVVQGESEFVAKPRLATDNPSAIGIADVIIVTTKSFDLENVIKQLQPCINQQTIILPLLNGVDAKERIKNILPNNLVLDGCVYIVSRLKQPGVIEKNGNLQALHFGLDNYTDERLENLETLFTSAGIDATLSQNISRVIWEKFVFISPTATATSYFDKNISEVMNDEFARSTISNLIEEVMLVATAKQIDINPDIIETTLNKLKSFPPGATSSLHSDFKTKKPINELESLTGYVVTASLKYKLPTPTYDALYKELKQRIR